MQHPTTAAMMTTPFSPRKLPLPVEVEADFVESVELVSFWSVWPVESVEVVGAVVVLVEESDTTLDSLLPEFEFEFEFESDSCSAALLELFPELLPGALVAEFKLLLVEPAFEEPVEDEGAEVSGGAVVTGGAVVDQVVDSEPLESEEVPTLPVVDPDVDEMTVSADTTLIFLNTTYSSAARPSELSPGKATRPTMM